MNIINILNACLTPVIAILAVYIAYQQYIINKQNSQQQYYINLRKLNFDLYKLRYRIFNETKQILLKINQEAKIEIIEIRDYSFSINESKFLFDNDIVEFLKDLQKKSLEISRLTKELKDLQLYPPHSDERNKKMDDWTILIAYFTDEY